MNRSVPYDRGSGKRILGRASARKRVNSFAYSFDSLAAPKDLGADEVARHAEDALRLGFGSNPIVLPPTIAREIVGEALGADARAFQHALDRRRAFDVELASPEPLEDRVVIAPRLTRALRPEKPDVRNRAVEDLSRAAQ